MLTYRMFTLVTLVGNSKKSGDLTKADNPYKAIQDALSQILPQDEAQLDQPVDLNEALRMGYVLANLVLNTKNKFPQKFKNNINELLKNVTLSVPKASTSQFKSNVYKAFMTKLFEDNDLVFSNFEVVLFWVLYCYEKDNNAKCFIVLELKRNCTFALKLLSSENKLTANLSAVELTNIMLSYFDQIYDFIARSYNYFHGSNKHELSRIHHRVCLELFLSKTGFKSFVSLVSEPDAQRAFLTNVRLKQYYEEEMSLKLKTKSGSDLSMFIRTVPARDNEFIKLLMTDLIERNRLSLASSSVLRI
ncbi:MAG: hypothetical protein AB7F64_01940 [Gammaproteobacteria bacterium]